LFKKCLTDSRKKDRFMLSEVIKDEI